MLNNFICEEIFGFFIFLPYLYFMNYDNCAKVEKQEPVLVELISSLEKSNVVLYNNLKRLCSSLRNINGTQVEDDNKKQTDTQLSTLLVRFREATEEFESHNKLLEIFCSMMENLVG